MVKHLKNLISIYINGYINQHLYTSLLIFFISIIKIPVTAATYYYFHFALRTVSCHCITLYLTVSFCLHVLTEAQLIFFFKSLLVRFAAIAKFLSASQRHFFQVAYASNCLLRRHKSVTAIILKVILAMQHNSVNKTKKYKLKYWFPITYSLATPNKWDREKENTLLHADWNWSKLVKLVENSRASDTGKHELSIGDPFKKGVIIVREVVCIKLMTI